MATIPIVNTVDKRRGMIAAILAMLGLIVYLFLETIEMADPPPKDPVVMAETEIPEEIVLENLIVEGGADAGSPTDDEIAPPTPQTQEVITSDDSHFTEPSGQSTNTNANNQTNTSSTTTQSSDPFGSGGNNGETGQGNTFGNSTGPGTGDNGNGSGIARVRLNDPVFNNLQSNEHATITLILTIDGQGNIVSATCNKSKTSTTNQILINRVIKEVQRQVKYNKDPGAPLTKVSMTVKVKPE